LSGAEDGLLSETENAFGDIFAEFVSPNGYLPTGSVVLVGSVTHLGARGVDRFGWGLGRLLVLDGCQGGPGVEVVPLVPDPIGGVKAGGLIRDLFDLDSWLQCSATWPGAQLSGARRAFWEVVMSTVGVPFVAHLERVLFILTSSRNPRCRSFSSASP
jgi:hypothetical protein